MQDDTDERLIRKVTDQLDADSQHIDGESVARLNQARAEAVAALHLSTKNTTWWQPKRLLNSARWALPVGAFAASCFVALIFFQQQHSPESQADRLVASMPIDDVSMGDASIDSADALTVEEIELLADSTDLDFYQGMAFIEWLEQEHGKNALPVS